MEVNTKLEVDLRKFVTFNIRWLHFFGYFAPNLPKSSKKMILFRIYAAVFVGFAFVLMLVTQIANMIDSWGDMERMTEASFLLLTNFVQVLKMYTFMNNETRIWKLVHSMNRQIFQPRTETQYDIVCNDIKMAHFITKLFLFACTMTCASWGISPFLDRRGEGTRLPLSAWYPFNTQESPGYEIAYVYQMLTTWIGGLGDICMDTFMAAVIMVISTQLSILNDAIQILKQVDENNNTVQKQKIAVRELVRCAIHYKNIIKFSNEVTFLFTDSITGQFLVGVMIVCMSMFQMSLVSVTSFRFFAMVLYQSCVLTEMFLWCFYGNEVMLKSDLLTQSIYSCEWVHASNEFKQDMIIFMSRTQFPLKLYASGYFGLNLETYKAILKSSWSYFAVLRQVHDKQNQ